MPETWTHSLFTDYHLRIDYLAGEAWSDKAAFAPDIPEDAEILAVNYHLHCKRFETHTVTCFTAHWEACSEASAYGHAVEVNRNRVLERVPHICADQYEDGHAYTTKEFNEVRVGVWKATTGNALRVDYWFDCWVEIIYNVGASGEKIGLTFAKSPSPEITGVLSPIIAFLTDPIFLIFAGMLTLVVIAYFVSRRRKE